MGLAPQRERNWFDGESALSAYLPQLWALFGLCSPSMATYSLTTRIGDGSDVHWASNLDSPL